MAKVKKKINGKMMKVWEQVHANPEAAKNHRNALVKKRGKGLHLIIEEKKGNRYSEVSRSRRAESFRFRKDAKAYRITYWWT